MIQSNFPYIQLLLSSYFYIDVSSSLGYRIELRTSTWGVLFIDIEFIHLVSSFFNTRDSNFKLNFNTTIFTEELHTIFSIPYYILPNLQVANFNFQRILWIFCTFNYKNMTVSTSASAFDSAQLTTGWLAHLLRSMRSYYWMAMFESQFFTTEQLENVHFWGNKFVHIPQ